MIDKRIIDDASDFLASERVSSQTSLLAKSWAERLIFTSSIEGSKPSSTQRIKLIMFALEIYPIIPYLILLKNRWAYSLQRLQ
jgi:hypothetical protein